MREQFRFVDPTIKTIEISSLFHEHFSAIIRLRMIFDEALEEITLVGLTINSKNKEYYPDNEPWKFKVRFETPLNLSGFWTVALTDVLIRDSSKTTCVNNLYVHCSVAGESNV
jgi:hypothetical protein